MTHRSHGVKHGQATATTRAKSPPSICKIENIPNLSAGRMFLLCLPVCFCLCDGVCVGVGVCDDVDSDDDNIAAVDVDAEYVTGGVLGVAVVIVSRRTESSSDVALFVL